MGKLLFCLIKFDLKLFSTRKKKYLHPFIFYIITAMIFPFSTNGNHDDLKILIPSIISIAILFASLISTNQIFDEDYEDGFLEQKNMFSIPPYLSVLAKIIVHWLVVTLPIVVTLPLIFFIYGLDPEHVIYFIISTVLISLITSSFGIFSATLTIGINNGASLSAIISMPLTVICLIFFAISTEHILMHRLPENFLSLLKLMLGIALVVIPCVLYLSGQLIQNISNNFHK